MGPAADQRDQIKQAALKLVPGEQLASAAGQDAEIEGVTAILLLTDEDHFNALAATTFAGDSDTPVYRVAPSPDAVAPYISGDTPRHTNPLPRRHTRPPRPDPGPRCQLTAADSLPLWRPTLG